MRFLHKSCVCMTDTPGFRAAIPYENDAVRSDGWRSSVLHIGVLVVALLVPMAMSTPTTLRASQVLATVFFDAVAGDPAPTLQGIIRIDLNSGIATPFIPTGTANLTFASDLLVAPNGNLYVSSLAGFVLAFDPHSGAPLPSPVPVGFPGLFAFTNGGAQALSWGTDGNLYVATSMGSITKYDPATGTPLDNVVTGLAAPDALAFQSDGSLIYDSGEFGAPGGVFRKTNSGTQTLVPIGTPGFDNPSDILLTPNAVSPARMLVADFHGNKIHSYALDGSDPQIFATVPPAIPDPLPPGVDPNNASNFPSKMLVSANNTILLGSLGLTRRPDNRGSILEYGFDGTLLRTIVRDLPPISSLTRTFGMGDLNQDGRVDGADAALLFLNWNSVGVGDLDRSGAVDGADLALVYANWSGDNGRLAEVPEPHGGMALLAGMLLHSVRRRNGRH